MHSIHIFNSIKCVKLSMESVTISTGQLSYTRTADAIDGASTEQPPFIKAFQQCSHHLSPVLHSSTTILMSARVESRHSLKIIHPLLTTNSFERKSAQCTQCMVTRSILIKWSVGSSGICSHSICCMTFHWKSVSHFETIETEHHFHELIRWTMSTKNRIYQMDFPMKEHKRQSRRRPRQRYKSVTTMRPMCWIQKGIHSVADSAPFALNYQALEQYEEANERDTDK